MADVLGRFDRRWRSPEQRELVEWRHYGPLLVSVGVLAAAHERTVPAP